ncbi:hypothetical protein FEZ41_13755 [Lentilactobacillus parafarraginis]|jgi:hypothetical protein|uniref:Uncharacterized protein n=1 Tax=Lentilactobacillus parafarraginis TaxID=390842 RepID=A0A5R9CJI2_9LACO|nr:hypothetical protein [Lentilactobacillus parafarraginis]TLQ15466.1 hypothetical protein FEZ41_13755 [Lentilactobacillus parafarraginis]
MSYKDEALNIFNEEYGRGKLTPGNHIFPYKFNSQVEALETLKYINDNSSTAQLYQMELFELTTDANPFPAGWYIKLLKRGY